MNPIRPLVYVCNYAADYAGNFIRSLHALAVRYEGAQVLVLPSAARGKQWVADVRFAEVIFCDLDRKSIKMLATELLKKLGSDAIVYLHFMGDYAPRPFLSLFKTVIVHYHMAVAPPHGLSGKVKRTLKRASFRLLYPRLLLVGVSVPVCDSLLRLYPASRVECVPNAIDFSRFRGSELRRELNAGQSVRALLLGTHFLRKGADTAIEAVGLLRDAGHDVVLTIAVHDVAVCRGQVTELLGVCPEWVKVVPVRENVESLYEGTDVFLSPSRSEAFGYAVLEAAWCGCEVVASDVPGQNTLKDVPGVRWVSAEDPRALVSEIVRALESPNSSLQLKKTRAYLEEHYGIDRWVDDEMAILRKE